MSRRTFVFYLPLFTALGVVCCKLGGTEFFAAPTYPLVILGIVLFIAWQVAFWKDINRSIEILLAMVCITISSLALALAPYLNWQALAVDTLTLVYVIGMVACVFVISVFMALALFSSDFR